MSSISLKYAPNLILTLLGVAALLHSILHHDMGVIPEAILALVLFLKAFAQRKQSWNIAGIGLFATLMALIVNSYSFSSGYLKDVLSWLGIVALAVLAFSRFIFDHQAAKP
jgi:hypothetical protein